MTNPPGRSLARWELCIISVVLFMVCVALMLWIIFFRIITPPAIPQAQALKEYRQLPAILAPLLRRYVNKDGMVDYKALQTKRTTLEHYLAITRHISPDSHPTLFPTRAEKLAYWINAYNASILRVALDYPSWNDLYPTMRKARFFVLTSFAYGGKWLNLRDLENKIIRKRFREPRIHFAINCASFGCPKLPREPFRAATLERQLQRETLRFMAETRNVSVNTNNKVIQLSALFKWFRKDFLDWLNTHHPTQKGDPILVYINLYRNKTSQLPTSGYRIVYRPYDWRINTQHGPKRNAPQPKRK